MVPPRRILQLLFVPIYAITIASLGLVFWSCDGGIKGEDPMADRDLQSIIRALDPDDDVGLEGVAHTINAESSKGPARVLDFLHSDNEDDRIRGRAITLEMTDVMLMPMFEALNPSDPDLYVWDMHTIVDTQMAHRVRIAGTLETMLQDKRPLTPPRLSPRIEEKPPRRRVCDDAYLMMRQLLSLDEDGEELFTNAEVYLDMTDEDRDEEISRVIRSRRWIVLREMEINDQD